MDRIADAFVWPARDPEWVGKILLMGLILIIPLVGPINGLGWMLAALDRLRAGDVKLPPVNFDHLGRGFRLFVVYLAYYLVVALAASVIYVPSVLILAAQGREASSNVALLTLGVGLLLLAYSFVTLASLILTFAMPAVVLAFDKGGIAGGLNVAHVVRLSRASLINTLIAGLMLIAAGLIGGLGIIVCLVGIYFTSAYAFAMQAWIIRSFEQGAMEVTGVGRATA